jgi:hypothetical protein
MSYLTTVWNGLDAELSAEIAAGKHKEYAGVHQLRLEILAAEAEAQARSDAYGDVTNRTKRWMD